jgi:hypothetical protein
MNDLMKQLSPIVSAIIDRFKGDSSDSRPNGSDPPSIYKAINSAFLTALTEQTTESFEFLERHRDSSEYGFIVRFYQDGLKSINDELEYMINTNPEFAQELQDVSNWFRKYGGQADLSELAENSWKIFFPEAVGIYNSEKKSIENLRERRLVKITKLNNNPIISPPDEIIFTSNALLTVPSRINNIEDLGFSSEVKTILSQTINDKQRYWYDHPIQIGVEPEKNEVLYGMRALDEAITYEKNNRKMPSDKKLTCILSASVTHERLHQIAQQYLEDEFHHGEAMENLNIYLFTENETDSLISEVLVPAAEKFLNQDPILAKEQLQVFGVDGEYGRHYSFLKAIVALWHVFIDPSVKATFKIDLDQVFPQDILVNETGSSAFEHLCTPLWGAEGVDADNVPVDLGMIAGALVNEKDIQKSLFTADVPIPEKVKTADGLVFFSRLPQAISTEAEMLTRYNFAVPDGKTTCIQRVHVTGGTNGILIKSLFKYRPFTPSFFGRAEDQAYIMSVLDRDEKNLSYVHKDGLIMRHDKEAFAQEAMKAAHIGKLVGDYTRILYFSAYSNHLAEEKSRIKKWLNPFTGCFISNIPITVVFLRFALRAMQFFQEGKGDDGMAFIKNGTRRIDDTMQYISEDLESRYRQEHTGWELYYNILQACQSALNSDDKYMINLKDRAQKLIKNNLLNI